jgi:hypothetical protein
MSAPAIVRGMSPEGYRAAKGLNYSHAKRLLRSPLHFAMAPEKPPSAAMILGTVTHDSVLLDQNRFVVRPTGLDFRSAAGKAWRDSQRVPVLTEEEAAAVAGMREAVQAHPTARAALELCNERELSVFVNYRGCELKARIDACCLNGQPWITDLKTTTDASPDAWGRTVAAHSLLVQAAWYRTVLALATGCEQAPPWAWICVESEAPHACAFYRPTEGQLELGQRQMDEIIDLFLRCQASGEWGGYGDGELTLELPGWFFKAEENRQLRQLPPASESMPQLMETAP